MTKPNTISQLIADLENAEEGSRELDTRIYSFLNPDDEIVFHRYEGDGKIAFIEVTYPCGDSELDEISSFTTSIDAAMTTIPEGWELCSIQSCVVDNEWFYTPEIFGSFADGVVDKGHKSIAISICIASLCARLQGIETIGE